MAMIIHALRRLHQIRLCLAAPASQENLQFLQHLCFAMKQYLSPNARIIPAIPELTIKQG
jgi:hypothetical protein